MPMLDNQGITQIPTRHLTSNQKIHDWRLKVHKPIIFIGNTNLARISSYHNPQVLVDSFPGANFFHIAKVLLNLSLNPNTQKVSVGINNREQHFQKTSKKKNNCSRCGGQQLWPSLMPLFTHQLFIFQTNFHSHNGEI